MNSTPYYLFSYNQFENRIALIRKALGNIPICYSIKANPFLIKELPSELEHVEVCSPGELTICEKNNIPHEKILYSGVMKEEADITRAINYGVDILTAESERHIEIEQTVAKKLNKNVKVLLRLTSGNQFGMSDSSIYSVIKNKEKFSNVEIIGLHYYSGTQKKFQQIEKDLEHIGSFLKTLKEELDYSAKMIEYGPGLGVNYFNPPYEESEKEELLRLAAILKPFSEKYPLALEFGRFVAAPCGMYVTGVKDIKTNNDVNFVILDGGIHHLKYYGQTMSMQVPPIYYLSKEKGIEPDNLENAIRTPEMKKDYCLCGSLCTVADVLVRRVGLPNLSIGDCLVFDRCGAYSVTEGTVLFLSRQMPKIYYINSNGAIVVLRDFIDSDCFNT